MSPESQSEGRAKRKPRKVASDAPEVLTLDYELSELPSAQHRAGLAGLVLMVEWLRRQPEDGNWICELTRVDDHGATLRIDRNGVRRLFDETYAATIEERREDKPRKEGDPPLRIEVQEIVDAKGKTKEKTVYVYPQVVPKAGLLLDLDPTREGNSGAWVKLWRDMIWSIVRGIPKQRGPFLARAEKGQSDDADDAWESLTGGLDRSVDLPSTYYLGAQAATAEYVRFYDRARFQFLLHFWPYVAQVYVPTVIDAKEGKTKYVGFAIAVPDVSRLRTFCDELLIALTNRGKEMSGYRPRESVLDLPIEAALDMASRLKERVARREGAAMTVDLIHGVEVFHAEKDGNNVRILSTARLDPEPAMVDHYKSIRQGFWDPVFRRVRLLNLVKGRAWYAGFDRVAETMPYKTHTIGSKTFRRDARESFKTLIGEGAGMNGSQEGDEKKIEVLIYKLVQAYVLRKVEQKHGLSWEKVKDNPERIAAYNDAKEKIARDAFLAVRSRSGADFVDYFAGTLASAFQPLNRDDYVALTRALRNQPDEMRQVTLLALSANG